MSGSNQTKVAKWGNGAAVRLNTVVLEESNLRLHDAVEMIARDGEIIIRRVAPEVTLDALLDRFDPAIHRHDLMLNFPPVGTETGAQ